MKIWPLIPILFLGVFATPRTTVWAASPVVLNEIMPHPSNGNDWVELYNTSDQLVDLSGWSLKDSSSVMKTLSGSIDGHGFAVFEVSNRLNNAGDTVTLIDAAAATVDSYPYGQDPGVDVSYGRSPDGSGAFSTTRSPTKNAANAVTTVTIGPSQPSTPTISPTSTPALPLGGQTVSGIVLSEYLPAPKSGEDEWVELYNSTDTEANVGGFKIDDIDGGSPPFTIPAKGNTSFIPPRSYKTYILSSARFNNDGDSVRLLTPDGQLLEQTSYADTKEGVGFAKDAAGNWQQTTTLTPGADNIITKPELTTGQSIATSTKSTKSTSPTPKATTKGLVLSATNPGSVQAKNIGTGAGSAGLWANNDALPVLATASSGSAPLQIGSAFRHNTSSTVPAQSYIASALLLILVGGAIGLYKWYRSKQHANQQDTIP